MDISKFKDALGADFAALESYVQDLTGQRDAARKESVEGRKALKAKAETAEALNHKLMEKLGIESPDDVDTLPPAKGQAEALKQLETKLRRYETDLKTRDSALAELTGKHRHTLLAVEINKALAGKEPVDRDVIEAYLRQQVEWQDEQILYKGDKGHTSLADGVTLLAQSKPGLFKTGARGSGWNPNPDHGQAPAAPPTTADIYAARQPKAA